MPRRKTLREKVEKRIARKGDAVFLPREFVDLGGEDQIPSKLTGQPILAVPDGFVGASRAALNKLGVKWEPTEWERAYCEGRSTQVPVNAVVRIKGRFARQLGYRGNTLVLER
jgi:hypothetical protein